ncbi:MAG: hypothetical protein EBR82_23520 [Caulobacteraceae bacterium]|nr:hypothetical protein [Caulobacteraceae bacterium]
MSDLQVIEILVKAAAISLMQGAPAPKRSTTARYSVQQSSIWRRDSVYDTNDLQDAIESQADWQRWYMDPLSGDRNPTYMWIEDHYEWLIKAPTDD